jgi:hypothetical protein
MYATFVRNNYGACGTYTLCNFAPRSDMGEYQQRMQVTKDNLNTFASIGVFYAGFLEADQVSERMFAHLCSLATPVYVSPRKVNPNSGKMFYFAVFELDKVHE